MKVTSLSTMGLKSVLILLIVSVVVNTKNISSDSKDIDLKKLRLLGAIPQFNQLWNTSSREAGSYDPEVVCPYLWKHLNEEHIKNDNGTGVWAKVAAKAKEGIDEMCAMIKDKQWDSLISALDDMFDAKKEPEGYSKFMEQFDSKPELKQKINQFVDTLFELSNV